MTGVVEITATTPVDGPLPGMAVTPAPTGALATAAAAITGIANSTAPATATPAAPGTAVPAMQPASEALAGAMPAADTATTFAASSNQEPTK